MLFRTDRVPLWMPLLITGCTGGDEPVGTEPPHNAPPTLTLESPTDGRRVNEGEVLAFSARLADDGPVSDLALSWHSNLDGVFGTTGPDSSGHAWFEEDTLSAGTHDLTVTAADTGGLVATDIVRVVVNGLPSAPVISLIPDPPGTQDDLVVRLDVASLDTEGDPITYDYAWEVDGQLTPGLDTDTAPSTGTARNQHWRVIVTPSDPHGVGDAAQADVTIANTWPEVTSVALDPGGPTTDTVIAATAITADADADPVASSYVWYVDGTPVVGTGPTLDGVLHFDRDQQVYVEVTATDGSDAITVPSGVVVVQNSPPDAPTAAIAPMMPQVGDDLRCAIVFDATDRDADPVSYAFAWEVDGVPFVGAATTVHAGDTVLGADASTGLRWSCSVTPSDGTDIGPTVAVAVAVCPGDADEDAVCDLEDTCPGAFNPTQGRPFGPRQILTDQAVGARSVGAADLDGDGDTDVVLASKFDDTVAWYENLGDGSFGPEQILTDQADVVGWVFVSDLDGDGDPDVLSASRDDDTVAWYENLGSGTFGAQQIISTEADHPWSVHATDLDSDGDPDVLSASVFDDTVAWYENLGGGVFGPRQVITDQADGASSVFAADLDGDGDPDVLSASQYDDTVAWYENLGSGAFGPQQVITTRAVAAWSVVAADLDGDGDLDVVSASPGDDKVAWYENLGAGAFGPEQIITVAIHGPKEVHTADLDADGDIDVLSASGPDDRIAWYQNHGGGSFSGPHVITGSADGASSVHTADLDGDGTLDVLAASYLDDTLSWYANHLVGPADDDADGTCDAADLCAGHDDGLDTDGDGIPNGCDDCLSATDSDGDGVVDDCDVCPGDPDTEDVDGDAVPDACDPCPDDDPDDSDVDGVCDSVDVCEGDDANGDTDADGWCNNLDRCPGANDGLDEDSDGVPDACDRCLGFDDARDGDADGAPDLCDVCLGADDAWDRDADAVPDGCDQCEGDDVSGDLDADGWCLLDVAGTTIDCDDDDPAVFPGAPELCDGRDNDCDGVVDDGGVCARLGGSSPGGG